MLPVMKQPSKVRQHERRERRKREKRARRDRWQMSYLESDWPVGPNIVSASPAELEAAIERLPDKLTWEVVAPLIIPLFERVRPYPPGLPAPLQVFVPPGMHVGLGVDIGPAFITVSDELAAGWRQSAADLAARAMGNLHATAADISPTEVVRQQLDAVETAWLQTGCGIGSVLVLAPTELERIFGGGRRFIAPMRDLLIGLPDDVEPGFAGWLYAEIASQDPNCLHPRLFGLENGQLRVESLLLAV